LRRDHGKELRYVTCSRLDVHVTAT